MTGFSYRDGALCADNLPVAEIAATVGTPFYCYSATALRRAYTDFAGAFDGLDAEICYAVKANSNQAVIALFAGLGAGADVVSEGELRRALAAGVLAAGPMLRGAHQALRSAWLDAHAHALPQSALLHAHASPLVVNSTESTRRRSV